MDLRAAADLGVPCITLRHNTDMTGKTWMSIHH